MGDGVDLRYDVETVVEGGWRSGCIIVVGCYRDMEKGCGMVSRRIQWMYGGMVATSSISSCASM